MGRSAERAAQRGVRGQGGLRGARTAPAARRDGGGGRCSSALNLPGRAVPARGSGATSTPGPTPPAPLRLSARALRGPRGPESAVRPPPSRLLSPPPPSPPARHGRPRSRAARRGAAEQCRGFSAARPRPVRGQRVPALRPAPPPSPPPRSGDARGRREGIRLVDGSQHGAPAAAAARRAPGRPPDRKCPEPRDQLWGSGGVARRGGRGWERRCPEPEPRVGARRRGSMAFSLNRVLWDAGREALGTGTGRRRCSEPCGRPNALRSVNSRAWCYNRQCGIGESSRSSFPEGVTSCRSYLFQALAQRSRRYLRLALHNLCCFFPLI